MSSHVWEFKQASECDTDRRTHSDLPTKGLNDPNVVARLGEIASTLAVHTGGDTGLGASSVKFRKGLFVGG